MKATDFDLSQVAVWSGSVAPLVTIQFNQPTLIRRIQCTVLGQAGGVGEVNILTANFLGGSSGVITPSASKPNAAQWCFRNPVIAFNGYPQIIMVDAEIDIICNGIKFELDLAGGIANYVNVFYVPMIK